jgi:CheY-like chemotaxis protein
VRNRLHERIAYESIEVGFYEPTAQMRTVVRSTLHAVGFRRLHDCQNVDGVVQRLSNDAIDLLIIDVDSETDAICGVVRQVREGRLGYDPFLAIMALTSNAVPAMINRVLGVGCDDLIARPISPKVIAERTANLVHHRKPFVVTADYVGPDRGARLREDDDLAKVDVPNVLRDKALGDSDSATGVAALRRARAAIGKYRISKFAAQIGAEALRLKSCAARGESGKNARNVKPQLAALLDMIAAVSDLVAEQSSSELELLSQSMTKLARSIAIVAIPDERQLALLHLHGEAIAATANNREEAAVLTASVLNDPMSRAAE